MVILSMVVTWWTMAFLRSVGFLSVGQFDTPASMVFLKYMSYQFHISSNLRYNAHKAWPIWNTSFSHSTLILSMKTTV